MSLHRRLLRLVAECGRDDLACADRASFDGRETQLASGRRINTDVERLQNALLTIYLGRENEPAAAGVAKTALALTEEEYQSWLERFAPIKAPLDKMLTG